jgi:hypothetical protein
MIFAHPWHVGISGHNCTDWNLFKIDKISPNFGNAIESGQWYTDVKEFSVRISVCVVKWLHIKFRVTLILFACHCTPPFLLHFHHKMSSTRSSSPTPSTESEQPQVARRSSGSPEQNWRTRATQHTAMIVQATTYWETPISTMIQEFGNHSPSQMASPTLQ